MIMPCKAQGVAESLGHVRASHRPARQLRLAAAALWLWLAGRAAIAGVLLPRLPPSRCYSVATRGSPLQWSPVVHRRPYAHH